MDRASLRVPEPRPPLRREDLLTRLLASLAALLAGCDSTYLIASRPCATPCEDVPQVENVRAEVHGASAIVEFDPVAGAVDYRVYPLSSSGVYRCAGDRLTQDRRHQAGALFEISLAASVGGYARAEEEASLGYVFTSAGPGRVPVHRVSDPNGHGGYLNAEWIAPLYHEAHSAEYVASESARAALLRLGWRDDGIAFYAPEDGERAVYTAAYEPEASQGARVRVYFADGPEHDARAGSAGVIDFGERFRVYAKPRAGTVPLRRVTYFTGSVFDVLAAGDGRFERVLYQSGPLTSLSWPELEGTAVLVIEALDAGCPFGGGFLSAFHAEADLDTEGVPRHHPAITEDEARLPSGELYINGQHDPRSRPGVIARSYVEVAPRSAPAMAFYTSFDDPSELAGMREYAEAYARVYRNEDWAIDTTHCGGGFSFGAMRGQLVLGLPQCVVSVAPRRIRPNIARASFLHVRASIDIPSTPRRFPQLLITTAPLIDEDEASVLALPVHDRLGPAEAGSLPGAESTIIVQPYHDFHELQIQFCDQRGWGPLTQCPRANVYGHNAGDHLERWDEESWTPVPVMSDRAGFDRPVQLDVYASTERVYVFVDERPAGCAVLPADRMPEGDVTVAYAARLDEPLSDSWVLDGESRRRYERTFSLQHSDRRLDDFGIDPGVPMPPWDESVLPCGERWYGGALVE